jgi:hypothetical protein
VSTNEVREGPTGPSTFLSGVREMRDAVAVDDARITENQFSKKVLGEGGPDRAARGLVLKETKAYAM